MGGACVGGWHGRSRPGNPLPARIAPKGQQIVAVCTGHGLKDPDILAKGLPPVQAIAPKLEHLEEMILKGL